MRQLANRAVFDEVGGKGSGHFACNRVSRLLLSSHPQSLAPFVGQWGNDTYDAARWQVDSLRSKDAGSSAFQLGNGGKSFFAWLHEPAQKSTAEKVNASQLSFNYFLQQGIIEDFDWAVSTIVSA